MKSWVMCCSTVPTSRLMMNAISGLDSPLATICATPCSRRESAVITFGSYLTCGRRTGSPPADQPTAPGGGVTACFWAGFGAGFLGLGSAAAGAGLAGGLAFGAGLAGFGFAAAARGRGDGAAGS